MKDAYTKSPPPNEGSRGTSIDHQHPTAHFPPGSGRQWFREHLNATGCRSNSFFNPIAEVSSCFHGKTHRWWRKRWWRKKNTKPRCWATRRCIASSLWNAGYGNFKQKMHISLQWHITIPAQPCNLVPIAISSIDEFWWVLMHVAWYGSTLECNKHYHIWDHFSIDLCSQYIHTIANSNHFSVPSRSCC